MSLIESATPMHYAVEKRDKSTLLQATIHELLQTDDSGDTLLHYAVANNDLEITKLLFYKCPALLNMVDKTGKTALYWAKEDKFTEVIAFLKKSAQK